MKYIITLSIVLFLFANKAFSQVNFMGYLMDENEKKITNVTINLYEQNKLLNSKKFNKKFSFDLDLEKYYTLELIKEGFIPKRIAISTFEGSKGSEPFMFVMELLKERDGVDNSDLDFPSALIEYKKNRGEYTFNNTYSKSVKKEHNEALHKE